MPSHRLRLLHIEDDPDVVVLVSRALRDIATVDSALSLAAARSCLGDAEAPAYDLFLVDLSLPDSKGIEAIAMLKAYRVPIIVISNATCQHETMREVAAAGADDYLSKGDMAPLVERVRFVYDKAHRDVKSSISPEVFEALKPYISSQPPFVIVV